VGGVDMMAQAIALGKGVHVIVGTPGRVVDHLSNTKAHTCTRRRLLCCPMLWHRRTESVRPARFYNPGRMLTNLAI
jgi:hypothetical protein